MAKTLYLVSCVKTKQTCAAPAAELYTSSWFNLARAYVEPLGPWLILSAKHGVLEPTDVIEPYEESLDHRGRRERREWGQSVFADLLERTDREDTVVFLAGEKYRENLIEPLRTAGRKVVIPMRGLRSGEQKQWLIAELKASGVVPPRRRKGDGEDRRARRVDRVANSATRATISSQERRQHLIEFYAILGELGTGLGGARLFRDCHGRMEWPERGVYFFFEPGEERSDSGSGPRVVRVGTHAVGKVEGQSFWTRLRSHRGTRDGGRHRTSVFRRLIGASLVARDSSLAVESWGQEKNTSSDVLEAEHKLERLVSQELGAMMVLWLDVYDAPSSESLRSYIERNSIALLSNAGLETQLDPPSSDWLGHDCPRPKIRASGLWNSNHVAERYEPVFLERFKELATAQLEGKCSANVDKEFKLSKFTRFSEPAAQAKVARSRGAAHVGQREEILEHIKRHQPQCDDCVSDQLNITPRQRINQIARKLEGEGRISRATGLCHICKSTRKFVNILR